MDMKAKEMNFTSRNKKRPNHENFSITHFAQCQ